MIYSVMMEYILLIHIPSIIIFKEKVVEIYNYLFSFYFFNYLGLLHCTKDNG